jgi:hypothetical protein
LSSPAVCIRLLISSGFTPTTSLPHYKSQYANNVDSACNIRRERIASPCQTAHTHEKTDSGLHQPARSP